MTFGTTGQVAPGTDSDAATAATWSRDDWLALADRMLAAARPFASPGHALVTFPGPEGGYGRAVDGLEGFARTFLLAGFRIAGERGVGLDELVDWYAAGIAAGTDPSSPDRWVRLDEHAQAKVEAASIALVLDLTRPWIWDRLPSAVQERVVDYLAPGGRRRHLPADQLGLVPAGRPDVPALGRRAVVARRHGRGPRHPRRLRPRGRLDVRRAGARLRPLRRLGAAPLPDAVGADGRRRRPRRAAPRTGPGRPRPLPAATPSRWSAPTARR